jgi:hypothetical protein
MQIGFGIGLTFPLKPGEDVEVPPPSGGLYVDAGYVDADYVQES